MRTDGNNGAAINYEPNSFGEWKEQPEFREAPIETDGPGDRWDFHLDDADYYSQPRALFRLMTPAQQQALFDNTARAMGSVPEFIKRRHIEHCLACDAAYGHGVARAMGIEL